MKRDRVAIDHGAIWTADRYTYGPHAFLRERAIYAVAVYRFGRWIDDRPDGAKGTRLLANAYWAAYRLTEVATGISLPKEADFGPGLRIHHAGPIVVHPDVVAGANCVLRHGVTIGERLAGGGVPCLGDDVEVGAFAQILGSVSIGDGAKIGAMALVLDDVPDNHVALAPKAIVAARGGR